MKNTVEIRFGECGRGRTWKADAGELTLKKGDRILVETDKGPTPSTVVRDPMEMEDGEATADLKKATRILTPEDEDRIIENSRKDKEAFQFCLEKIKERDLAMKLVRSEFLFDGSKAIFFFTAEGRIDFRELVRDLARRFHTRIEMFQIGVRDEAKLLTGFGICGRPFCCSSWIGKFDPVSIKMAKDQNLSLNPAKVSGVCGRLMCCLCYEHDLYLEVRAGLPKVGKKVVCSKGKGKVTRVDVLARRVFVALEEGKEIEVLPEEIQPQT